MTTTARADVRVVAVSRLANYIGTLFARERAFARLGVRGEVSNLRVQPNGNAYFDLKDRDALLNCVAFSEAAASFPELANGAEVVAYGTVQTYAKASRYQLRVFEVVAEGGAGALHRRYEALKKRLEDEGLFAEQRKRPLPRYPFRVALVTSESADGARDFVTQARARAPHVEVVLVPTPVQGERAAPEIARAIARASAMPVDLIVLARGGGSFEDLFAFSEERVVRALAASRVPTVSAIGHEADVPLTDFVADHRAPTPSAAAQTVLPRRDDLLAQVRERARTLHRDAERAVAARRQHVDRAGLLLGGAMRERIRRCRERLVALDRRLRQAAPAARLAQRRGRFEHDRDRLARA
ncbi:MAG TPA: exodeoxyribonuclease VII large subunit, partial [Candidatus Elarobacter sp.]|nr:exodeoxyribonuclease VII large subunit [Candidatus Elarobacter sp.]